MAGALTERDFVDKLSRAGLRHIEVVYRRPVSIDVLSLYPLFTDELLALMRRLIPTARQAEVATAIVVTARNGEASGGPTGEPPR